MEVKQPWWKDTVIYQIYPRSFKDSNGDGIGDLRGIMEKVEYLAKLGVGMVWLCPVYASPNDDNGYDVSDYYSINPEFGTMEDMEALTKKLREHGIRLMMDLVFNHTSDQHRWFKESRSSRDNPYRDYYVWRAPKADGGPPNNWRGFFNEPAWEFDKRTGEYYLRLYTRSMPDLNWECEALREEVYAIMEWWADKGVDGFRMDTINTIGKDQRFPDAPESDSDYVKGRAFFTNQPTMHRVLHEMNRRIFAPRSLVTVGECSAADIGETLLMVAEEREELSMNHMFEHDELDFGPDGAWDIVPFTAAQLYDVIERWQTQLPAGGGWNSWFWGNHDLPRPVSRFGSEDYAVRSAKALAALQFTMLATPFIYQGEELGMMNAHFTRLEQYRDVDALNYYKYAVEESGLGSEEALARLRYRSRDNSRTPMQWSAEKNAGFTEGEPWIEVIGNYTALNAAAQETDSDSVLNYYRRVIALRAGSLILRRGDFRRLESGTENAMVYERCWQGKRIRVTANLTDEAAVLTSDLDFGGLRIALNNAENTDAHTLLPWQAVIWEEN